MTSNSNPSIVAADIGPAPDALDHADRPVQWVKLLLGCMLLAISFFVLARFSFWFMAQSSRVSIIWPANAVSLAALLVTRRRSWPFLLAATYLGSTAASALSGRMVTEAIMFALANIVEPLVAAAAISMVLRRPLLFTSIRDVITFTIAGCCLGSMAGATVGAAVAVIYGAPSVLHVWGLWAVVDAMGLMVVTPVIVTFWTHRPRWPGFLKALEALSCVGCCTLLLTMAHADVHWDLPLLLYFPHAAVMPFLIWACLRFDLRIASLLVLLVAGISAGYAIFGRSPMAEDGYSMETAIVTLQTSTTLWSVCALMLAAVTTERKSAAEALAASSERARLAERGARENHDRLQAVFHNSTAIIFMKDLQGRYQEVNPAFEDAAMKRRDQILGRTDHDLFPKDQADVFREEDLKVISSGQPLQNDLVWTVGSRTQYLTAAKFPLRDADGNIWAICGVVSDVTERMEQAEALRQARDQAELANLAKSEFLANISHEIRTPMTSIFGYTDLLLVPDLLPAERIDHIQTIRRNGEHLLSVLNDLLDMSKIEAGQMTVEHVPCSLPEVVSSVVSLLRQRAMAKEVDLAIVCRTLVPKTIQTDPTRLRQILLNLVGNAIKFTSFGRVEVALWVQEGDAGSELLVTVTDTGIGMTPQQVAGLGQPFRQGDPSHARQYGGTGLGVSICYRLAALMGGSIGCDSVPSKGTVFTLRLPIDDCSSTPHVATIEKVDSQWTCDVPPELSAALPQRSAMGSAVLIAEDSLDTRRLLTLYLDRVGIQNEIAENGKIAVARAMGAWRAGRPYDLILMDMQMPEMDGASAVSMLRAHGYTGRIVAVTASALTSEQRQCLAHGCDDVMCKPLQGKLFLDTVRRHLQEVRSAGVDGASAEPAANMEDQALRSELAADLCIRSLLPEYLAELHEKTVRMDDALADEDWPAAARLAHQIKGSAGTYGYPGITAAATLLEESAKSGNAAEIALTAGRLISLCRQATMVEV